MFSFAQLPLVLAQSSDTPKDQKGEIDVNPEAITERIDAWVDGTVKLLPNIGVAIVLIIIAFFVGGFAKRIVNSTLTKRGRDNLGDVLGGFLRMLIIILGILLALTVVIPSLNPGDLIAGLGVSSVAIGFAFKDILQNWLAGLLILMRQPFEIKDQIEINGYEGTVERIETRATIIKTYDGQRVVVPNSDIYTNAVLVKTAHEKRRSQYDVGIGYADDIQGAISSIKKALSSLDQLETDPEPEVIPWALDASWVTLRVRWWTDSRRADVVKNHGAVIEKIKLALDDAGIDMPYDTQVHLFHDQTEDTDGDRSSQREGWPAGKDGSKPRWKAQLEESPGEKS